MERRSFPLPLWERVARRAAASRVRGSLPAQSLALEFEEATPHPALRATFSHKGRREDSGAASGLAHHGLQIIMRLDDLDQAILSGAVAAVGVGVVLLHQRLVLGLDVGERGLGAEAHHLERLALGVHDLARLGLGRGLRAGAPAGAAVELLEHAERIEGAVYLGFRAFLDAAIGAHLPGRTMTGQRILLIARDSVGIHAGEEIVVLVVLAHMIQAEVPVLTLIVATLGRTMRALVLTPGPFAIDHGVARLHFRLLAFRLDPDGVEEL